MENFTIVCFRTRTEQEPTGTWRADLGERPKMRDVVKADAMVWLNEGTEKDLQKARDWAFLEGEGWSAVALTSPAERKDPQNAAKRIALQGI